MSRPLRLACLLALALALGSGCADPVVQYHRQFEYLVREGGEALEEQRFEDARKHLLEASQIAQIAAATDLELIGALTELTRACRELGRLEEAVAHATLASQVLARHRLAHGGTSSGVYRVGAAYLLERGRLEIARGDLDTAEAVLSDFVKVRGEDGGDARESAEAQLVLGELRLARGFDEEARDLFAASLEVARGLEDRDPALRGFALYRAAERKLERGRGASAAALLQESLREGQAVAPLRPSLLLLRGRLDVDAGNAERGSIRLEEAFGLLESQDASYRRDSAAPTRAIELAAALHPAPEGASALEAAVLRALAVAEQGSPLRAVLAGHRAVEIGRAARAAGAAKAGMVLLVAGRDAIAKGVGDRVHDAGVEADFEIARALELQDRWAAAAPACNRLVAASDRLSIPARDRHPERLLACGRIGAARRDANAARTALGRALMIVEEAGGEPVLRMELLLRLAALAHDEGRDAEEGKLFDRVLPFVMPGVYDDLERLLVDAYSPYGRFQPSSAAARLGHAAARSYAYAIEAPQLQALAEQLGATSVPASR